MKWLFFIYYFLIYLQKGTVKVPSTLLPLVLDLIFTTISVSVIDSTTTVLCKTFLGVSPSLPKTTFVVDVPTLFSTVVETYKS